jgi:hypothetical protein
MEPLKRGVIWPYFQITDQNREFSAKFQENLFRRFEESWFSLKKKN